MLVRLATRMQESAPNFKQSERCLLDENEEWKAGRKQRCHVTHEERSAAGLPLRIGALHVHLACAPVLLESVKQRLAAAQEETRSSRRSLRDVAQKWHAPL